MLKHFIYVQYVCENQSKVVYSPGSASTGSVPNGNRSVTSSVTSAHKNVNFGGAAGKKVVLFFSQTLQGSYSYLRKLGYSELVQGQFEKMAFSLVDPLLLLPAVDVAFDDSSYSFDKFLQAHKPPLLPFHWRIEDSVFCVALICTL